MTKLNKNVILEGVFGSENVDTTGEVLDVKGADITHLVNGYINVEHINPTDLQKESDPSFRGFTTIIGRVTEAKKIFTEKDCATKKELESFKKLGKPMIYGQIEIWDGPDAPENAKAAASIVKMLDKDPDAPRLGLSVEGSTLKRDGNILKSTVIRGLAATLKPANRAARVELVGQTPELAKSEYVAKYKGPGEPLFKSVDMSYTHHISPKIQAFNNALNNLHKALTASGGNAAPSSLTGGAVLAKEDNLQKLARFFGKRNPKKDQILKALPSLSEEEAESLEKAMYESLIKDNTLAVSTFYSKLQDKK